MKRILVFTPFINRGDTHRMVEQLMSGLESVRLQRGWTIEAIGQLYDEDGVLVHYPFSWKFTQIEPSSGEVRYPNLYNFLRENAGRFVDELRHASLDHDLIFCPNMLWSTIKKWDILTPLVALVNDIGWDFIDMGDFLELYFSESLCRVAESAALTIFTGEMHRALAVERYGFKDENTLTVNNSADLFAVPFAGSETAIAQAIMRYDLPEKYILLPNVAHTRGMEDGLIAYGQARLSEPGLPPLVICGDDTHMIWDGTSSYGRRISKLITGTLLLKPGKEVIIAGKIERHHAAAVYAGAEATLVTTHMDGDLSATLLEAVQARSPIIFSALKVFTDRLGTDDQYGWSFPPADWVKLSQQIVQAHNYRHVAEEKARKAFAWAQEYRVNQVVSAYAEAFERVMSKG